MPRACMRVVVCPALGHPRASEDVPGEGEAKRRIGRKIVRRWVVTRLEVVAVLEKIHVVTEPVESKHVLKMVPRVSRERTSDHVSEHENSQLRRHHPICASISLKTTRLSKHSCAI